MKQKNNFQIQENFNEDLKILQACELENFKLFKKICDDNNLRYYMIGGTLIGVVRHNGFIPWDDDIDIGLPRPDYNKFLEIEKIIKQTQPELFKIANDAGRKRRE